MLRKKVPAGGGSGQATYTRAEMPVYDYSYLVNEALWDSYYFSGASPRLEHLELRLGQLPFYQCDRPPTGFRV